MLPLETVGNPQMEAEYLASRILHGNINDPNYLNLRMNLAGLVFVDASQPLTDKLTQIKKIVVGTQGLIDRPVVKQYYKDEAPELKSLIKSTLKEIDKLIVLYSIATTQKFEETFTNMSQDLENAPMTYEDVGEQVNKYNSDNDHITQMDQTNTELKRMEGVLNAILRVPDGDNPRVTNKEIPAKLSTEYKLFLNDLSQNLDVATNNMHISMVVGQGLDAIISTIPKDDLDPYLSDVCNNIISVLTDPESFYTKCKSDQVISSAVGQLFGHCYPEYYGKYQDMYMDEYSKMDQQEVLEFRKCFGLDSDDSELTTLCSQYVKLGFTQQQ